MEQQDLIVFHIKDVEFFTSQKGFNLLDESSRTLSTKCKRQMADTKFNRGYDIGV
jgi:hypothetical protein